MHRFYHHPSPGFAQSPRTPILVQETEETLCLGCQDFADSNKSALGDTDAAQNVLKCAPPSGPTSPQGLRLGNTGNNARVGWHTGGFESGHPSVSEDGHRIVGIRLQKSATP